MEAAVGLALATFQFNDEVNNVFIKFLKSKDFENLSVKEKKEFIIELKNTSYSLINLYNLFALSYERLLKKDDSTFSNLDTLMSVFAEEFKNIQMEEFENMISKPKQQRDCHNCKHDKESPLEICDPCLYGHKDNWELVE